MKLFDVIKAVVEFVFPADPEKENNITTSQYIIAFIVIVLAVVGAYLAS